MTQGEIKLPDNRVFRWMLQGTTKPEIYGWIEENHTMIMSTAGFYRTTDPEVAVLHAVHALGSN
jgi:hypothetical protein